MTVTLIGSASEASSNRAHLRPHQMNDDSSADRGVASVWLEGMYIQRTAWGISPGSFQYHQVELDLIQYGPPMTHPSFAPLAWAHFSPTGSQSVAKPLRISFESSDIDENAARLAESNVIIICHG